MALQEFIDQSWNTDSGNYFENKRQYQQAVNDEVARQRNINTAKKAIARNLKKGLRAKIGTAENAATGSLVKMAKDLGITDPFAGAGLNQEVGDAREKAAFTLNENFLRAKRQEEELRKRTGGAQNQAGANPQGNQQGGAAVSNAQQTQNQPQAQANPTIPDWANDVANDKTFPKGFFDDPKNLATIQGKSRAEVADMLNKARVARFMNGITTEAARARTEEVNALKAPQDVANKNQLTPDLRSRLDAMYANPDEFNRQQIKEKEKTYSNIFDNDQFINQVQTRYNEFNNIANNVGKIASQNYKQSPKTAMKQDRRVEIISDINNKTSLSARQAATNDLKIKAIQESSRNAAMQKAREEYLAFQQKQIVKQYTY